MKDHVPHRIYQTDGRGDLPFPQEKKALEQAERFGCIVDFWDGPPNCGLHKILVLKGHGHVYCGSAQPMSNKQGPFDMGEEPKTHCGVHVANCKHLRRG